MITTRRGDSLAPYPKRRCANCGREDLPTSLIGPSRDPICSQCVRDHDEEAPAELAELHGTNPADEAEADQAYCNRAAGRE